MSGARRVFRNAAYQVVGDIAGKVVSLAFYVVLARELGPDAFGTFTFGLSLALLVVTPAGFGIDTIVAREIARDRRSVHRLVWNALAIKAGFGCAAVAIAIAIAALGDYSSSTLVVVTLLSVSALVELMAKTLYSVFLGLEDMRPPAVALLAQRMATSLGGTVAVLAGAGVVTVAVLYAGGVTLTFAWTAARVVARTRPRRTFSIADARALLTTSLPSGANVILSTVLFRVDTLILSLLKGTVAVGVYGAAYRLLESTLVLSYAVAVAMLPTFSRLAPTTRPTLSEAYASALKVVAVTLVPVGCVFALFAAPVIELVYGADYAGAVTALRLLGGAAALYGVSHLALYVLIAQSRQRSIPWITGCVLVLNIGLNLMLIPRFSLDAAAFATSISELVLAILMTGAAVRISGALPVRRILTAPLAGAASMGLVAIVTGASLVGLGLALCAYALTVITIERWLHPRDIRLLADVLRRRSPFVEQDATTAADGRAAS